MGKLAFVEQALTDLHEKGLYNTIRTIEGPCSRVRDNTMPARVLVQSAPCVFPQTVSPHFFGHPPTDAAPWRQATV